MKIAITAVVFAGVACVGLGACAKQAEAPASTAAAAATTRVRGTAESVNSDALKIRKYDGQLVTVPISKETGYAWVVRSSLADVKKGDFIGTATTGPDNDLRAVEVVIFPEAMRGVGEGHYEWDIPSVIASAQSGQATESSAMTNGTVTQRAMTNGTVAQSAMTNGTVTTADTSSASTRLTVTYKGGTSQVFVPPEIPIVRFEPTQMSVLGKGQKLFVVLSNDKGGKSAAKFVAIGKDGLVPPM